MSESPIVKQYLGYLARSSNSGERSFGGGRIVVLLASAAFGLILLIIAFNSYTNPYVPAGHEGYVFERPRLLGKGGFRGTVAGPGNYGVSWCRNEVTIIDVRPKTYTEPFKILAKDDLNIGFDFHAVLSVRPGTVRQVVDEYGGQHWYERFVRAPFRTFIRETVQAHESRGIKTARTSIAEQVQLKLADYLADSPFVLVSLVVGNIDYPEVVARAVERKLAAQQVLEEKETQRAIARKDAAARVKVYKTDRGA